MTWKSGKSDWSCINVFGSLFEDERRPDPKWRWCSGVSRLMAPCCHAATKAVSSCVASNRAASKSVLTVCHRGSPIALGISA